MNSDLHPSSVFEVLKRVSMSAPQAVAIAAYEMGFEKAAASIIEPTKLSRKVLRAKLTAEGANFIMGDGYYAFIDCTPYIEAGGFNDSEALMTYLGEKFGIAVVAGVYFSQAGANWVRRRPAT